MNNKAGVSVLTLLIVILAAVASSAGIWSRGGPGQQEHLSIRGDTVLIYGEGIYQHMSKDLVPQGIAQDVVTLFIGIPLLLGSLFFSRRGSLRARFVLAGILSYFLVTYLLYLLMVMYNAMFLLYVALLACSFFAFLLVLFSFNVNDLPTSFHPSTPVGFPAWFLIVVASSIALLWLGAIIPPLVDGTIFPAQLEHQTTLVVQGIDLGLLLPGAFVSGLLLLRRRPLGYLLAPVYVVFLSVLMVALTAKLIAMAWLGFPVVPAIFIIPTFALTASLSGVVLLRCVQGPQVSDGRV